MKIYEFGLNFDPILMGEEAFLTIISVPAKTEKEAWLRLQCLVGRNMADKCWLNDIRDY